VVTEYESEAGCVSIRLRPHPAIGSPPRLGSEDTQKVAAAVILVGRVFLLYQKGRDPASFRLKTARSTISKKSMLAKIKGIRVPDSDRGQIGRLGR
jgi:hypothetical protein